MLEELRNELYSVEEKITEYNKEIEGSTKYMTAQMRIKEAEKELETADSQKKGWLNQDIRRWKKEVEEAKENISSKFDLKKKKLISDLKTKITEYCNAQKKVYEGLISDNKIEIDNLINLVANNNEIGNYKDVAAMSQRIYDLSNLNMKYSKNLEKISDALANIDNYNEINEFKSVIYDLSLFSNEIKEAKLDNKASIESITNTKDDVSNIDDNSVINNTNSNESEIDSKNKDDVSNDTKSDFEDVYSDANDSVDLARKALEEAKETKTKKSLNVAKKLIDDLKDSKEKDELLNEFNDLVISITGDFMSKADELYANIDMININTTDLFDGDKVKKVINMYDNLYSSEVSELEFNKLDYSKKLNEIIHTYNMQEQNNYKLNKEVTNKKPFSKFQILKEFRPLFITKIATKLLKKRIERNIKKGNEEKVEKDLNKMKEVDIINSPKLFVFKNKLSELKPKLYKKGLSGLSDDEKAYYDTYNYDISAIMLKRLLKIDDENEAIKDKLRVKTVIGQWLELLSKYPEVVELNGVIYDREEVFKLAVDYIKTAHVNYETISNYERNSYISELQDICNYREKIDEYYEIPSEEYENRLSSYEELNTLEVEYYKQPKFIDDEKTKPLTYMKKSRK